MAGMLSVEAQMEGESVYGLRLDQLAAVFSLGVDDPDPAGTGGDDESVGNQLWAQLSCPLPTDSLLFESLIMMMGRLGCDVRSLAGRSRQEVLLCRHTDVGLLQAIKDCSKTLSASLDSKTEATLAVTIYYAALASALAYHGRKISRYSYETLERSFATFAGKRWVCPELADLFLRAGGICRDSRGTDDSERTHTIE
jgi:hypothetical protein